MAQVPESLLPRSSTPLVCTLDKLMGLQVPVPKKWVKFDRTKFVAPLNFELLGFSLNIHNVIYSYEMLRTYSIIFLDLLREHCCDSEQDHGQWLFVTSSAKTITSTSCPENGTSEASGSSYGGPKPDQQSFITLLNMFLVSLATSFISWCFLGSDWQLIQNLAFLQRAKAPVWQLRTKEWEKSIDFMANDAVKTPQPVIDSR